MNPLSENDTSEINNDMQNKRPTVIRTFENYDQTKIELFYMPHDNKDRPIALVIPPHFTDTSEPDWAQSGLLHSIYYSGFNVITFFYPKTLNTQYPKSHAQETADLTLAKYILQLISKKHPNATQTVIAGVEYGAYIALQLSVRKIEIAALIAVNVPDKYDLGFLTPCCPSPGLFIHLASHPETPVQVIENFVRSRQSDPYPLEFAKIPGQDFSSKESKQAFVSTVRKYLSKLYRPPESSHSKWSVRL